MIRHISKRLVISLSQGFDKGESSFETSKKLQRNGAIFKNIKIIDFLLRLLIRNIGKMQRNGAVFKKTKIIDFLLRLVIRNIVKMQRNGAVFKNTQMLDFLICLR
jgi:hypothetical protein